MTARPWECSAQAAADRIVAAQPPAATIAASSASAVQRATADATALALGRRAEHAERSPAVVRRVGVQPDPPIGSPVVAGDGVPTRG